jgi:hypothetical protein
MLKCKISCYFTDNPIKISHVCFSIPNYRTTFSATFSTIFTLLFPAALVDMLGQDPT